jgi:hypothetical protein
MGSARVADLQAELATREAEIAALRQQADEQLAAEAATAATLAVEKAEAERRAQELEAQFELDRAVMRETVSSASLALTKLQDDIAAAEALHAEQAALLAAREAALAQAKAEATTLQTTLSDLQARVVTLEDERARAQAAATQTAQSAEEAYRSAQEATIRVQQATTDAETAHRRLSEETERAQAAEADRAQALAQLKAAARAEADRRQATLVAFRELVYEAAERFVRVEVDRARRNQGTPAKLLAWAKGFYLIHEAKWLDGLRPVMRTHLAAIGSSQDVDAYTRAIVAPQLLRAQAELRAVAEGDPDDYPAALEALLTRWERERPAALADLILQEEVSYVRSL